MTPGVRLLLATVGLIYLLKAVAMWTRPGPRSFAGLVAFLFAWPGVIPGHFQDRRPAQLVDPGRFLSAWARMVLGLVSMVVLAIYAPDMPETVLGLAGIAAILLTIHLGICDLLPWLLRWAGFAVPLLFDRPWAAKSLTEFWSRRWNLAFVEMNRHLLLRPFCRALGKRGSRFALFACSGLLHELGLSYPAGAGWGRPMGYFLLHAVLVEVEERYQIANRVWTWLWLAAPAAWLFHAPFRRTLVVPFYQWLHGWIAVESGDWYLSQAIYAAAIGHLCVLLISVQVPSRLGWSQDIPKLTRFNQKVFYVYGCYILLCIVSFAVLTWQLHDSFLAGDPAARAIASFIAVFWSVRVLIDIFWYDHRDWPEGNTMVAGHALATSLFCTLAAIYWVAALG